MVSDIAALWSYHFPCPAVSGTADARCGSGSQRAIALHFHPLTSHFSLVLCASPDWVPAGRESGAVSPPVTNDTLYVFHKVPGIYLKRGFSQAVEGHGSQTRQELQGLNHLPPRYLPCLMVCTGTVRMPLLLPGTNCTTPLPRRQSQYIAHAETSRAAFAIVLGHALTGGISTLSIWKMGRLSLASSGDICARQVSFA